MIRLWYRLAPQSLCRLVTSAWLYCHPLHWYQDWRWSHWNFRHLK